LSKLELKRQEQELIDAEVERRLKKKQFEKKVAEKLQEKLIVTQKQDEKSPVKDTIQTYLEDIHKDINYWSSLGDL
jgi:hypothetical protein